MPDITTAVISYSSTQDTVIKKFVDEAGDQMQVGIIQATLAHQDPGTFKMVAPRISAGNSEEDSVGLVLKEFYTSLPAAKQREMMASFKTSGAFTPKLKMDVASNRIDMRSTKYALDQIDIPARFSFANAGYLQSLRNRMSTALAQTQSNNFPATTAKIKKLRCKLHQIKCNDETGNWLFERGNNDEINLAGSSVSDKGVTTLIAPFRVSSSFDDGDVKAYDPPKVLHSFTLDNTYPKNFGVFITLAEIDGGGFLSIAQRLFIAVRREVERILEALAAKAGTTVIAIFGGKLFDILSALATLILNRIFGVIMSWIKDDVFEPQMIFISLKNEHVTFNGGSLTSEQKTLTFHGHDGEYVVKYSLELER
jgi:hypothetical protein